MTELADINFSNLTLPCVASSESLGEICHSLSDCSDEDIRGPSPNPIESETTPNSLTEILDSQPFCFEGPEKTMEVCFEPGIGHEFGLRALTRHQLDILCTEARCSILSKISSNYIDAYVLSESSLFVYKHRWIMKTCGTTTLLRCLDSLLKYADELGMVVRWVGYSRKNLNDPSAQQWPHSNFSDEVTFLNSNQKLQARLNGVGHILGPVTGDHWFVYVADLPQPSISGSPKTVPPSTTWDNTPVIPSQSQLPQSSLYPVTSVGGNNASDGILSRDTGNETISSMEGITLNMMMFDLNRSIAELFYKKNGCDTGKDMTLAAGIHHIVPGSVIDSCAFTPCGYSMNAILHDTYSTIHVTPEPQCSYASFETNSTLPAYTPFVRNILNLFGPKRFVLTMFADDSALKSLTEAPSSIKHVVVPRFGTYTRTSVSTTTVEGGVTCVMMCFAMCA